MSSQILKGSKILKWVMFFLSLIILSQMPALYHWRKTNDEKALSLSNLRRLTASLQLYMQDYDDFALPTDAVKIKNQWVTWPIRLRSYGANASILDNPSNPVPLASKYLIDPRYGYRIQSSYAINSRLNNIFGKGPFPMDNLEMPELTAIFVEAGPMWTCTGTDKRKNTNPMPFAYEIYYDTLSRFQHYFPYPSTHEGTLIIGIADGHAAAVHVEHYSQEDGPHNQLYGRIGGMIYNWNGGHPNGDTDHPPLE